jgi:hypothetical protein
MINKNPTLMNDLEASLVEAGVKPENYISIDKDNRSTINSHIQASIVEQLTNANYNPGSQNEVGPQMARQVLEFLASLHERAKRPLDDDVKKAVTDDAYYARLMFQPPTNACLIRAGFYDKLGIETDLRAVLEVIHASMVPRKAIQAAPRLPIRKVEKNSRAEPPAPAAPPIIVPEAARPGYCEAMLSDAVLRRLDIIDDNGKRTAPVLNERVQKIRDNLWSVAREKTFAGQFQINEWVRELSNLLGHSSGSDKSPSP